MGDGGPVKRYALDVTEGRILTNKWVRLACKRHLEDLVLGPSRGLEFDKKAADRAIEFFPMFLKFYEGAFDGKPFDLLPFQQFIIGSLFGWKTVDKVRRFRTAYIEMGKGGGKALAVDTPIPTPCGWKAMGDLEPGDAVFDENGAVCNVIGATDVMHGRPCYRMEFSDGSKIVADEDHVWRTASIRSGGKHGPKPVDEPRKGGYALRTTGEIAKTLRVDPSSSRHPQAVWNHRVDIAKPLLLPEADLPIDPYTLGVWLGDGDSGGARITIGDKDASGMIGALESVGCAVGDRKGNGRYRIGSVGIRGIGGSLSLNAKLRGAELLGNKHIPKEYLRASIRQRMDLLCGLMDTDGYVSLGRGRCEFTTVSPLLRDGFTELVRSLGYKPMVTTGKAMLNGKDCGEKYRVEITAYKDASVFRLERKTARLRQRPSTRPLSQGRMVVGCDPIESVPVRCIEVDSPSKLYLAGSGMIPTHNSPLAAGVGLYGLVADGEAGAEVYSAATTKDQAGILFRDAKAFVDGSAALRRRLVVDRNNIAYATKNSYFRPVSSEHRGLDGKRPHIALIDEIHEHPSAMVVDKMRAGTKGRTQALIFEITNAGYDRHSICYQHHEYTEKILEGTIENDAWFGFMSGLDVCEKCTADGRSIPDDECPDCDSWKDESKWIKANPGLDIIIPRKYLREQVAEASEMPSKENIVKRLNFCIWTESVTKWLSMEKWNACADPVDADALKGRTCYAGLDLSSVSDITAWVKVFPPEKIGGKYQVLCRFFIPEGNMRERSRKDKVPYDVWTKQGFITTTPGDIIDYAYVLDTIKKDAEEYDIAELAFDRWGSQKITTDLQDMGFEVEGKRSLIQFGQGFASMSAPTKELEKMVRAGEIAHSGHPVLTWMISNTVVKTDPAGNLKPDKEHSTERIDGVVALIMGISRAMLQNDTVSVYEKRGVLTW